jgi:SAM-dependent methyltransferase/thymidine kinase
VSLTVLTGLPGSGKSTYLIRRVNEARAEGRLVKTFECSESPKLQADEYVRNWRIIGSREPELECPLDHFVSTTEAVEIVRETPPGALVAFEEAHYFAPDIVAPLLDASARGLDVLLAMPSDPQMQLLVDEDFREKEFAIECERCQAREATTFMVLPDGDGSSVLCAKCDKELGDEARAELAERLERQAPYPGEKTLYQPVELREFANWTVLRPDSEQRLEIMIRVLGDAGLLDYRTWSKRTYVDVGCNTGFFCNALATRGFHVEGVDVVADDVEVAKILGSFFRRQKVNYVVADCYEYLRDMRDQVFDVTSAFSVFQWLMLQRTFEHGVECIDWLFEKTGRVCFLEMGYAEEDLYKGQLPVEIDRAWTRERMDRGGFDEVRVFEAAEHGLMRDLFVGLRRPS